MRARRGLKIRPPWLKLKMQLHGHLDLASGSGSIGLGYGGGDHAKICRTQLSSRVVEVRVIEQVVAFQSGLEPPPFAEADGLGDRQIEIHQAGSVELIPP